MVKFCFECGAKNNGGRFCAECGTRFTTDGASASDSSNTTTNAAVNAAVASAISSGAAATAFNTAKHSYQHQHPMMAAVPMAVPVNGGAPPPPPPPPPPPRPSAFAPNSANALRSSFNTGNTNSNAYAAAVDEPVPPAATGADAQDVYESCVRTIRGARGGNNEAGVKAFKQNCKLFGLKQMDVQAFYDSLVAELGAHDTRGFVPHLARLIPDDRLRTDLVEYNARQRTQSAFSGGYAQSASYRRDSSSSSDSNSSRPSMAGSASGSSKSRGLLKNRYADAPNCDICHTAFDVTKRRHQCRRCGLNVCNACTPVRLLIPPGMEVANAKKFEPSVPQRVCIQCAPQLHQYQDELVAQYAQSHEENLHEGKGALIHVPFSNSLLKECNNAADIIGNFFRDSWGASTDRSIPVAFLERAHGLAIMTIVKAGFLISGKIGTGLVVAKLPNGSWSPPSAIGTVGLSGGFELGGEIIEVMIILGSERAVKVFHKPQVNLGAGLDVTVGPYGRVAQAAAAVSASGLNANYSYSQSKGFFAGVSLQGAVIATRSDLNRKFYGRDIPPSEILGGYVEQPNAARPLYEAIDRAMQGVEDHKGEVARRSLIMGPCRLCNCPMFVAHSKQVWNKNCKTCKHVH